VGCDNDKRKAMALGSLMTTPDRVAMGTTQANSVAKKKPVAKTPTPGTGKIAEYVRRRGNNDCVARIPIREADNAADRVSKAKEP